MTRLASAEFLPELARTWHAVLGDRPQLLRDVMARRELRSILERVAGDVDGVSTMRLMAFLKAHVGREAGGFAVEQRRGDGNRLARWSVVATGTAATEADGIPEWAEVARNGAGLTRRLPVPGGWLYWHVARIGDQAVSGLVFVPSKP